MVSGRRDCWFPLLSLGNTDPLSFTYLCIDVSCKLPAMVNNSYFVSTTYQNSLVSKDSPRPCPTAGNWYCWHSSCFLNCPFWALDYLFYTLEVWAPEPPCVTLQAALFVTWICDSFLWPWPSILPTFHTILCFCLCALMLLALATWLTSNIMEDKIIPFHSTSHIFRHIFE